MIALTSVVLPEPVPPMISRFRWPATTPFRTSHCDGGHDARVHVLVQREHRHRLLADRKGWAGHDWRHLPGKAGTIDRQFAFQRGLGAGDFLAVVAGHGLDDRFGLGDAQRADARHLFAEALLPQPAIGIEHDFDGARVVERRQQQRPHVPLQLLAGAFLDRRKVVGIGHVNSSPAPCVTCNTFNASGGTVNWSQARSKTSRSARVQSERETTRTLMQHNKVNG
jgi:hypothetical protein